MSSAPFDVHGRLKCGTVSTPCFDRSLADYRDRLGLLPVAEGLVDPMLATSWGAPLAGGARYALLGADGGSPGFLRLVEGPEVPGYVPLRSYGWAAFEITVRDGFALHDRIGARGFEVLGAPKLVPGFDNFVPFQVRGSAGEVLYLNQVLKGSMSDLDLPFAAAEVDHMFIAVLAAGDRAAAVRFHTEALGFEEGETYVIPYSMINQSFGLPADFRTAMTMTKAGRLPMVEVDQYPPPATERPRVEGWLPPGNSMVSVIVRSLDGVGAPFLAPPAAHPGPLYAGRRAACVVGAAGELIELIEEPGA